MSNVLNRKIIVLNESFPFLFKGILSVSVTVKVITWQYAALRSHKSGPGILELSEIN